MKRTIWQRLLALASMVTLSGCPAPATTGSPSTVQAPAVAAAIQARFSGHVTVPAQLVSNNAGGLVSNNAGGYRISAFSEIPLANSLVYLLTPDEQFYNDLNGARIVTTTNASGDYSLPDVLPANKQVIVSALLAGNRRMVGYTVSQLGTNQVNISLATTYATEFLRAYAARSGKTMADYPNVLAKLPPIVAETQNLLNDGRLPVPDLTIGSAGAMNKVYFASFASTSQRLSDLWADLLGQRLIALSTVAGNYALGSIQDPGTATQLGLNNPTGVAVDGQGNLYIALNSSHVIRKVAPDGTSTVLGKFRGDGTITTPTLATDSVSTFAQVNIPNPQDLKCDPDGNLIASVQLVPNVSPHNSVLLFFCQKSGTYFNKAMTAGNVYPLGHDSVSDDIPGASATDSAVTRYRDGYIDQARFRGPNGLCTDDRGNIYFADRLNNLIRRIDRATGAVTTVGGRVLSASGVTYPDQLDTWDGVSFLTGAATQSVINRPFSVAWRRVNASTEELYVWEGTNFATNSPILRRAGNAIRKIVFQTSNPGAGTISTLAGGTEALRGYGGDGGPAGTAKIALVDPVSSNVPYGGMALSPDGRYLYFCDTINQRLRVIDLSAPTPTIDTAAGGGTVPGDSEAKLAGLKDVSGLVVDASGSVYFCDAVNNVVRKLNYQYGRP